MPFYKNIIWCALILFLAGCKNDKENKPSLSKEMTNTVNNNVIQPWQIRAQGFAIVKPMLPANPIEMVQTFGDSSTYEGMAHFTYYSTDEGLSSSLISCSCYDNEGNLWFGTLGAGITKYNGKTFTNYTTLNGLASNNIKCIKEDKSGNIWFGTDGAGLGKYDGRKFTTYTTFEGLSSNTINCITQDKKGILWFGTSTGISAYSASAKGGKLFNSYNSLSVLFGSNVSAICCDITGNLWIGLSERGICKYDGKNFRNYAIENNPVVLSLHIDETNNLWIGCNNSSLFRFNGYKFTNMADAKWPLNLEVRNIIQDKFDNFWFATNYGAIKYNLRNYQFYNKLNGLNTTNLYTIVTDKIKTAAIWMGAFGGRIIKYEGEGFANFPSVTGANYFNILSIYRDKNNNLWYGTEGGGIIKYNGKKYTEFSKRDGSGHNIITCIIEDNSNLWFGTRGGGVIKYNGNEFLNYTTAQGLAHNVVNCGITDKQGNIWFGTKGGGLSKFDGQTFTNLTITDGLPGNVILSIAQDKMNNIWVGTDGKGLAKFDGKNFTTYTQQNGLASNVILTITPDKSNNKIYVGTESGISILKIESNQNATFKNYSTYNRLPDNYISQIIKDTDGKLIIGTNNGIAFFNPSLPIYSDGKVAQLEIYNKASGYNIMEVVHGQQSMYNDKNGALYISTGNPNVGLVKFNKREIARNYNRPKVNITSIKLNNENVCWYSIINANSTNKKITTDSATVAQQEIVSYGKMLSSEEADSMLQQYNNVTFTGINAHNAIPLGLELPYQYNNISIAFGCNEVNKNFLVNYQYLLEGYDKNWSQPSSKCEVNYGNISSGTYTFKVKAQSPDGVWGNINTYTFSVLPPWYITWWAWLGYITCGIGILLFLFRTRTNALKQQQKYLEAQIIERTYEVHEEKKEVEKQKAVVEEKQKQIIDSINYAKHIQESILIPEKVMQKIYPNLFVLYMPKDIVSGDFYWFAKSGDELIIVIADCTGHGVPGAFLSMVGITLLNEIVRHKKITDPAEIIKNLAEGVASTLVSKIEGNANNDGMDISIIKINSTLGKCFFAGVNQKIFIVNNKEVKQIQPQVNSIRGIFEMNYTERLKSFSFDMEAGSMLYLLTDGYADQRGESTGKNFYDSRLEQLLSSIHSLDVNTQKQKLVFNFNEWKGNYKQSDDVLVVGIRMG